MMAEKFPRKGTTIRYRALSCCVIGRWAGLNLERYRLQNARRPHGGLIVCVMDYRYNVSGH